MKTFWFKTTSSILHTSLVLNGFVFLVPVAFTPANAQPMKEEYLLTGPLESTKDGLQNRRLNAVCRVSVHMMRTQPNSPPIPCDLG